MSKRNKGSGLVCRGGVWHIDKIIDGRRICRSTGEVERLEAEKVLARTIEEIRQAQVYGVRPRRTWRDAAIKYLNDHQHKRSISRDAQDLASVDPWIGALPLDRVHAGTLEPYIAARRKAGIKSGTVNRTLAVIGRVLRLAVGLWRDEYGLTWLASAPMIPRVDWRDKRAPAPLSWDEQDRLFAVLPDHLRELCLFAVHTGCREQEICTLRWSWEVSLPGGGFGFILPAESCKNGRDRLVVLNATARAVVNRQRGLHSDLVFTYAGRAVASMDNTAWRRCRTEVGLPHVRIHDLRHTFGRRLRAAGVGLETRAELMGHASGSVTTHYSAAEIIELARAVDLVAERAGKDADGVAVVAFRRALSPAKVPHGNRASGAKQS